MNLSNIISAGRMMAIVAALLGVFHCEATLVLKPEAMAWNIAEGAVFVVCGIALVVMLGRVVRRVYSDPGAGSEAGIGNMAEIGVVAVAGSTVGTPRLSILGTSALVVGTFLMLAGVVGVVFYYRNPFSWMMAIVALAIFIDVLCLKISLSSSRN